MLEINLRATGVANVTATPMQVLPSRTAGDNRSLLELFNKSAATTVMCAYDVEYNASGFSTATSGWPVQPLSEYWEQPGATPGNALYAWTVTGTAALHFKEG
jgi:hypothetical protein